MDSPLVSSAPSAQQLMHQYMACIHLKDRAAIMRCMNLSPDSEADKAWVNGLTQNNQLDTPTLIAVIVIYLTAILFGAVGNAMVVYAVLRNKRMRTPRNFFILNLAISDFTLCVVTQPFNLLRLLSAHIEWPFGHGLCKISNTFQGTNVYVSTFSIAAIALDRFQVIVYPTRPAFQHIGVVITIVGIWLLGLLMASSLAVFSSVTEISILEEKRYICSENLHSDILKMWRMVYTICTLLCQYVSTLVILIVAYHFICRRVRHRMVNTGGGRNAQSRTSKKSELKAPDTSNEQNLRGNASSPSLLNHFFRKGAQPPSTEHSVHANETEEQEVTNPLMEIQQRRQLAEARRQRRTTFLLTGIALVFALSWLPLNINNLVMEHIANSANVPYLDIMGKLVLGDIDVEKHAPEKWENALSSQQVTLLTAACLLCALMSACVNPVLYGWLNENFRKEFKTMCKCGHAGNSTETLTTVPYEAGGRLATNVPGHHNYDETTFRG